MIRVNTETADIKAIQQIVTTVERTQRDKDVEGFLALFHPDALWTTGHGKVLIGFDSTAEFTRTVLPAAGSVGEVTYEVVRTRFLRPDVAAVKVRQAYRAPGDGSLTGPSRKALAPPPHPPRSWAP
ncbi:SgcJ/EcaC family oxidoreductase [Streptomyces sp. NPDC056948]|uniref:SgcJ/EcaC family oxidoreductase n=1 Tax=Streptomyces sp. NPDC056948 TaxID=3345975 RepID=UPI00362F33EB